MGKIEKNMYVRTSKGKIRKFESNNSMARVPFMIKCSYNIIDLIEEGDYVNGSKVIDIVENDVYVSNFYEEQCIGQVSKKNIKSIVTKEQIESIKYEVE